MGFFLNVMEVKKESLGVKQSSNGLNFAQAKMFSIVNIKRLRSESLSNHQT